MKDSQKYALILHKVELTQNKIKAIEKDKGTFEKPIAADLIKTQKAMFFEEVLEILNDEVED